MRCQECGVVVFGPATFCQSCASPRLEQIELAPDGILYSYTIVRVPPSGPFFIFMGLVLEKA